MAQFDLSNSVWYYQQKLSISTTHCTVRTFFVLPSNWRLQAASFAFGVGSHFCPLVWSRSSCPVSVALEASRKRIGEWREWTQKDGRCVSGWGDFVFRLSFLGPLHLGKLYLGERISLWHSTGFLILPSFCGSRQAEKPNRFSPGFLALSQDVETRSGLCWFGVGRDPKENRFQDVGHLDHVKSTFIFPLLELSLLFLSFLFPFASFFFLVYTF